MEFTDSHFIIPVLEIITFFFFLNAHTFKENDYSTDLEEQFLRFFFPYKCLFISGVLDVQLNGTANMARLIEGIHHLAVGQMV